MKLIKLLVIGLAVVALVLAGIAGFGIFYVQHNDLRGMVSWAAKRQGYTVRAEGPVNVKLFPQLIVKANKLSVDSMQGSGELFAVDAAAVRMNWGKGPIFWKGITLSDVEAKNPTVNLTRTKDGVANWVPAGEAAEAKPKEANAGSGQESLLPMLVATRLAVANLNVVFDDQLAARHVVVKNMDMQATSKGTVANTSLSGSVNGQDVKGQMQVDIGNMDNIPVTAKVDGAGLSLAVDGRVVEQKEFAGQINAQTANLKNTLGALLGKAPAQAPADAFSLTGDTTLGAEHVVLRNFNTKLGDLLSATGQVDVMLGSKPSAKGQIRLSGNNLRQLAELGSGVAQPNLPAMPFTLATNLSGDDAIVLKGMNFALSNVATVAGDVKVVPPAAAGGQPDVDAKLNINVNNVAALAKGMGQTRTFPSQPLTGKVTLSGSKGSYSLPELALQLGDLLTVDGNFDVTPGAKPKVDGKFKLNGQNIQSTARAFGVEVDNIPTSGFKASASIAGQGTLSVDDLEIDLPQLVEAKGKLEFTPGKPANVTGSVNVTKLNANALGYCKREAPTNAAPVSNAPVASSNTPWSDEPINLQILRDYAVDVSLNVSGVNCESFPVSAVSVKIVNTPSQLDVKELVVNLPQDSTLKANATLQHAGTPTLMLNMTTKGVPVEELAPAVKAKGVALAVDMDASLNSTGATSRQLAKNLGGTFSLSSDKGELPYGNMLGNVANIQRMLSGDQAIPNNGSGKVDSLRARYTINQGVAKTDEFNLSTGGGQLKLVGTGIIDIGSWLINYTLTPTLTAGDALSIPVLVKGPLGGPSIGADPDFIQKLTSRLATEGVKGLLGVGKDSAKGIGGAVGEVLSGKGLSAESIGNLLGGGKSAPAASSGTTSPTAAPASSNTKNKVKVGDFLKALGTPQQ